MGGLLFYCFVVCYLLVVFRGGCFLVGYLGYGLFGFVEYLLRECLVVMIMSPLCACD